MLLTTQVSRRTVHLDGFDMSVFNSRCCKTYRVEGHAFNMGSLDKQRQPHSAMLKVFQYYKNVDVYLAGTHDVTVVNAMINGLMTKIFRNGNIVQHQYISPLDLTEVNEAAPGGLCSTAALISPWYSNGSVLEHIQSNPGVDRHALVFQLVQAVNHLHKHAIIHGNIYPGNILINQNNEVALTDTSVYLAAVQYIEYPSGNVRVPASARYKSPEDRQAEHQYMEESTYAMDVFAFASTAYAILNGEAINQYFMDHRTLAKPVMMRADLWLILQKCWSPDPTSRPCMDEVEKVLSSII